MKLNHGIHGTILALAMVVVYQCSNHGVVDSTPEIVSVVPSDGSDSVKVTTKIRIHFTQAMDTLSCREHFDLYTGYHEVGQERKLNGHFGWNDEHTHMVFSPHDSLFHTTEYTICLRQGMMGRSGHGMMMKTSITDSDRFFHFRTR